MYQRMFGRKTRPTRRRTQQDAWIAIDGSFAVRHCTVLDVSESGVRLKLDDPDFTARQFELRFGRNARGRLCRLIWRKGSEIGVAYI